MLKEKLDDLSNKGDWCFLNNNTKIALQYGEDSFKDMVVLPIVGSIGWQWNGNKELPTLTPSILIKAYEGWTDGWHGYLTDGKLIIL